MFLLRTYDYYHLPREVLLQVSWCRVNPSIKPQIKIYFSLKHTKVILKSFLKYFLNKSSL